MESLQNPSSTPQCYHHALLSYLSTCLWTWALGSLLYLSYPHRWSLSDFGLSSISWRYFSSMIISCLDLCNSLLTCLPSSLPLAASTLNMVADGVVLWKPRIMSLLCSRILCLAQRKNQTLLLPSKHCSDLAPPPHLLALSPALSVLITRGSRCSPQLHLLLPLRNFLPDYLPGLHSFSHQRCGFLNCHILQVFLTPFI